MIVQGEVVDCQALGPEATKEGGGQGESGGAPLKSQLLCYWWGSSLIMCRVLCIGQEVISSCVLVTV